MSLKISLNKKLILGKDIDYIFLIFLILLTQGNILFKVIGLTIIYIFRFNAIFYIHRFNLFYLFIIIYHLIHGLLILFFKTFSYVPNFLLTLCFWFFSFMSLNQITYFIKKSSLNEIQSTVKIFFKINVIVVFVQLVMLMIRFNSINPYLVTTSAGDFIKSIYSNSSVNLIIMSFFVIYFFVKKDWLYGLLATIILLMTTYMSGLVLFICSLLLGLFLFSRFKIKYKLLAIFFIVIFGYLFAIISPNNVTYATRYINRILENGENVPFKIKSFWQTINYCSSSLSSFVFGAGGGNFSSRVAFIVSGDYVRWFPDSWAYASNQFLNNHLSLWNFDFNNPWDNKNNTANQPFSFYNKIFGEYGLLGFILFYILYLKYILDKWKGLNHTKLILISLAGYFLLDYWFEYFSVIIIFELLTLIDIKLSNKSNEKFDLKTND